MKTENNSSDVDQTSEFVNVRISTDSSFSNVMKQFVFTKEQYVKVIAALEAIAGRHDYADVRPIDSIADDKVDDKINIEEDEVNEDACEYGEEGCNPEDGDVVCDLHKDEEASRYQALCEDTFN